MTNEKFNDLVNAQIDNCVSLLIDKGAEYSLTDDRLISFKRAAALQGETLKQALCGMMAKHVISVYDMCMSDKEFTDARWKEKITDTINYLLLLNAAIYEEGEEK